MSHPSHEALLALMGQDALLRILDRARASVIAGVNGEESTSEPDDPDDEDDDESWSARHALVDRGITACIAVAWAAAVEPRPIGMNAVAIGGWGLGNSGFEHRIGLEESLHTAVEGCGARIEEIPGLAARLAALPFTDVRSALAKVLTPARSEAVLRGLAADPAPEVRARAAATLGRASDAFPIPTDGHTEAQLAPARKVLEQATYLVVKKPAVAVRAFARLSDPLAIACWERLLTGEFVSSAPAVPWLAALLARPGASAILPRLIPAMQALPYAHGVDEWLTSAARKLPPRTRSKLTPEIEALGLHRPEPGASGYEADQRARLGADLLVALAPARPDTDRWLERALGTSIEDALDTPDVHDAGAVRLAEALARWPLSRRARRAMLIARRAPERGRWTRVPHDLWEGLPFDPIWRREIDARLRDPASERTEDDVEAVLGPAHVRAKDGTVSAHARALWSRPHLRPALMRHAMPHVWRLVRAAIHDGSLPSSCWHGAMHFERVHDAQTWAPMRRMREAAIAAGGEVADGLLAFPLAPRAELCEASDFAHLRAAFADSIARADPARAFMPISALVARELPETDAILQELLAAAPEPLRGTLQDQVTTCRNHQRIMKRREA